MKGNRSAAAHQSRRSLGEDGSSPINTPTHPFVMPDSIRHPG